MKKQNCKLLAGYSGMAAAFLILPSEAISQIYYTDIDPDIVLDNPNDEYNLDIDGDGNLNFTFLRDSFSDYSWMDEWATSRRLSVIGEGDGNYFVGQYVWAPWGYGAAEFFELPIALDEGSIINEEDNFYAGWALAIQQDDYFGGAGVGNWFPNTLNKFLGISFEDAVGGTHYGWIRCDVADDFILTIKDFAFEGMPDVPIITGDIGACSSPLPIGTASITSSTAKPKWESVPSADFYKLQYRIEGTFSWTSKTVDYPKTFRKLTGLECNTAYEWRIRAACTDGTITSYSPLQSFTTASCRLENENQIDEENIHIYSYSNQLFVNIDEDLIEPLNLIVYDQLGRKVFEQQITQQENVTTLDIPDGIYIVTLYAGDRLYSKQLPVLR